MAGHSRSKNGVASLAYVPAIHVLAALSDTNARQLFRAAIVREQQRGRSHVRAQKRLTSHLIVGGCQSDVLGGRMDIAQAAFEPAAHVGGSRAARAKHKFSRLF